MGRKTNPKSKEKRLQRKEEQMRLSQAMQIVAQANNLKDPLEPFPVFRKFNQNGINAELYVKKAVELEQDIKDWAFELTKKNMRHKYESCTWGWSEPNKREELNDEAAWYLIAKSVDNGSLLGFSHFRFDIDEGIEVLYCYELQLDSNVQRKSLGKFMMQILELIAFKNNMRKVVLTVLKNNQYSKFFRAINYDLDESSPTDEDEDSPYEILSKTNKRLPPVPLLNSPPNSKAQHTHCCSGHHHH